MQVGRMSGREVSGRNDPQQAIVVHDKGPPRGPLGHEGRHLYCRLLWTNDWDSGQRPGHVKGPADTP